MNLPNKLTILRIVMIPVFMAFFFLTMIPYNYFIAAIVFVLAAATDFLDGYIARKYHLVTNLGKFLDPIADKVLVSTALILMLTVDAILPPLFSIAVAVILARELIVSGFRMWRLPAGWCSPQIRSARSKRCFKISRSSCCSRATTFSACSTLRRIP